MRVNNWQLLKLAPVVLRESRADPCQEWDELLAECVAAAQRRELTSLLARLEREASPQSEAPTDAGASGDRG